MAGPGSGEAVFEAGRTETRGGGFGRWSGQRARGGRGRRRRLSGGALGEVMASRGGAGARPQRPVRARVGAVGHGWRGDEREAGRCEGRTG